MLLELGAVNRANARVRQEALDCICFLVRERTAGLGLSAVCAQPARAVPVIAQGVGDRDSNVRSAALAVLVAVGEQLPGGAAELWRLCGRMPERERSMLEERLKRSSLAIAPAAPAFDGPASRSTALPAIRARLAQHGSSLGAAPGAALRPLSGIGRGIPPPTARLSRPTTAPAVAAADAASAVPRPSVAAGGSRPMFSLDFDNLSLPSYSLATAEQLGSARGASAASPLQPAAEPQDRFSIGYGAGRSVRMQSAMPSGADSGDYLADPVPSVGGSRSVAAAVADLHSEDPRTAEAAIEQLQVMLDTNGPALAHVQRSVGDICTAVTGLLHWAYATADASAMEASRARIRKATVGLLIDIFGDARLAPSAPQAAVQVVLDELMQRLADPLLSASQRSGDDHPQGAIPNGEQLVKAVNALILKILDRADRTAVFVSLIRILDAAIRDPVPFPPQTDDQIMRGAMADVIMKCLWRISKDLMNEIKAQFGRHLESNAPIPDHVAYPKTDDAAPTHVIRVDAVLRVSEQFFVHIPGTEWRRREDRAKWMFGDLPKRTVKTISHSLAVVLRSHVWQFAGPLVSEAMRHHPGLLALPTAYQQQQDAQLAAWAADASARLARVSETWEYLCRALQSVGEPQDRPAPALMLALARGAIEPPAERSPLLGASPRLAYLQTPPVGDHARSPVLAAASRLSRAGSPGAPGAASGALPIAEHLKILRERITGGSQPSAAPAPPTAARRSPVAAAPEPATAAYGVAAAPPPPSSTQAAPGLARQAEPVRMQNAEELRQRIALLRNALRSQK
ncbi:hypothetical protein H4R19_003100 [Coemansia spiralis]|nr:hypothetical protein H4R19_003100 [Coemansia spiralis]